MKYIMIIILTIFLIVPSMLWASQYITDVNGSVVSGPFDKCSDVLIITNKYCGSGRGLPPLEPGQKMDFVGYRPVIRPFGGVLCVAGQSTCVDSTPTPSPTAEATP